MQPAVKEETSDSHHQDDPKSKKRGSENAASARKPAQNNVIEAKHDRQKLESKLEGKNKYHIFKKV